MIGSHWIRSTPSTQTVIGLSSGENEFYALVKGTSAGIGLQVMGRDLGREFGLSLYAMRLKSNSSELSEPTPPVYSDAEVDAVSASGFCS